MSDLNSPEARMDDILDVGQQHDPEEAMRNVNAAINDYDRRAQYRILPAFFKVDPDEVLKLTGPDFGEDVEGTGANKLPALGLGLCGPELDDSAPPDSGGMIDDEYLWKEMEKQ